MLFVCVQAGFCQIRSHVLYNGFLCEQFNIAICSDKIHNLFVKCGNLLLCCVSSPHNLKLLIFLV